MERRRQRGGRQTAGRLAPKSADVRFASSGVIAAKAWMEGYSSVDVAFQVTRYFDVSAVLPFLLQAKSGDEVVTISNQ